MKKFILFMSAACLAGTVNAQLASRSIVMKDAPVSHKIPFTGGKPQKATSSHRGTIAGPRWYNHVDALGVFDNVADMYDADHASLHIMWQDSSVEYVTATGTADGNGISYLSIGETFAPQSSIYTDPSISYNTGQMAVTSRNSYRIDSVSILGRYERKYNGYVDTLIFTVVPETTTGKFITGGLTSTSYGVDSFVYLLWSGEDYLIHPINTVAYSSSLGALGTPIQVKVPLTAAVFADSSTNGFHEIAAPLNISMPAGTKIGMSVTFVSGTHYTVGAPVTDYNYFAFLSHTTAPGDFTFYPTDDRNLSSLVFSDSSNTTVSSSAHLNLYYPTVGFNSGIDNQVNNISFKVTCTTCNPAGINDINNIATVGNIHPNPANNSVIIPVTMKQAAGVNVTLTNTVGQTMATQNLGQFSANQTKNAAFNTAALANGVYFITIEANGARTTNRFVVAH